MRAERAARAAADSGFPPAPEPPALEPPALEPPALEPPAPEPTQASASADRSPLAQPPASEAGAPVSAAPPSARPPADRVPLSEPPAPEPPAPTPAFGLPAQTQSERSAQESTGDQSSSAVRTGVITGVALPGMTPRADQVTNRDEAPQASPVRRSLKERMASAHHSFADPMLTAATTGNPLTQTNVSLGGMTTTDTAFQVAADGEITSAEAAVPIAAAIEVSEPAGVIDLDEARAHHLFLVSEAVDPAELEALAISMWDEAGWIAPGRLRLSSEAELVGPWSLDQPTRAALGTPSTLTNAWILRCPVARAKQQANAVMGEWAKAFPEGMPIGLEYRVLEALHRMARRLAGGMRIAGSGYVMVPDADSAVNLTVYSPRWINPEDLLQAMRERAGFEQMKDARDIVPEAPKAPALSPAQAAHIEKLKAELGPVRKDIASKIAKAREELEAQRDKPQVVDGYALMSPIGNRSDMMIEVHAVPSPPRVLRWEPWTAGAIIEYQVRWLPGTAPTPGVGTMSRTARLERLRSTQDVEKAAGMIATLVGGNVIDEDGFLVGLEEISPEDEAAQ